MAEAKVVKEMINEMVSNNNQYCTKKINEILKVVRPYCDAVKNDPKQDEGIIITVYVRKGNDIASNGYWCDTIEYGQKYDKVIYFSYLDIDKATYLFPNE